MSVVLRGVEVTVTLVSSGAVVLAEAVTVPDEGYAALVRSSSPLSSSVKLTFTLIFLPASAAVRV